MTHMSCIYRTVEIEQTTWIRWSLEWFECDEMRLSISAWKTGFVEEEKHNKPCIGSFEPPIKKWFKHTLFQHWVSYRTSLFQLDICVFFFHSAQRNWCLSSWEALVTLHFSIYEFQTALYYCCLNFRYRFYSFYL